MTLDSEKLATRGLALLIAYAAISSLVRSIGKLFWCDEVITVGLARLPTLAAIGDALRHAADSHPPTFHVLERIAGRLPFNELIAFRIPSILAFCCTLLCIFLFVQKRRGGLCGLVCAAVPLATILFSTYAAEARGYSLMVGFVALAMVCYQRADRIAWWAAMGISLAIAVSSHYYAIFGAVVFGLAELSLLVTTRRIRFGVWFALIFSALPLIVFWPLLETYKKNYGAHFSGRLSLDEALRGYGWLFNLGPYYGVGLAAAAIATVVIYGLVSKSGASAGDGGEIPIQEHVLVLGFLVLPGLMLVAIKLVHGGFSPRYLLLTILGFSLAASYLFSAFDRRLATLFAVLLFASLGTQEAVFWRFESHFLGRNRNPTDEIEKLVAAAGYSDLPVIDSDALNYLELAYYASPELDRRMIFVADVPAAVTYTGSDTVDKCVLALRPYLRLQVYQFQEFAGSHPEFLVYSDGRAIWDWWPTRLHHDGYALELVAMNGGDRIYRARLKP